MLHFIRNTFVSLKCGHLPVRLLTIMVMAACYALGVSMWLSVLLSVSQFWFAGFANVISKGSFMRNISTVSNDYRNRFAIWMDDRMRDEPEIIGEWVRCVFMLRLGLFLFSGYLPIKKEGYNVTSAEFKTKSIEFYRRFHEADLDKICPGPDSIFQPQENRPTIEEEFARQNAAG